MRQKQTSQIFLIMSEQEQNKRINRHKRQIADLQQRVNTLELDLDAGGRMTEAFGAMEEHIDEVENRLGKRIGKVETKLDKLERSQNEMNGKLDVILNHLTGINDLPEE